MLPRQQNFLCIRIAARPLKPIRGNQFTKRIFICFERDAAPYRLELKDGSKKVHICAAVATGGVRVKALGIYRATQWIGFHTSFVEWQSLSARRPLRSTSKQTVGLCVQF
uniref:F5/8 type C domain-containing protein n=1 Tax=Steinernema glaseri TaxID=37863 RepID=A0A1I8A0W2_9BILA